MTKDPVRRRQLARLRYARQKKEIQAKRRAQLAADPVALQHKREWERAYRAAHPEEFRGRWLKRKYGLTPVDFDAMFAAQGSVCAICGGDHPGEMSRGRSPRWHIDHDHKTGLVRGVLCSPCNRALGLFKENPQALESAIAYLTRARVAPARVRRRIEPLFTGAQE